jgi:hypothetical protein
MKYVGIGRGRGRTEAQHQRAAFPQAGQVTATTGDHVVGIDSPSMRRSDAIVTIPPGMSGSSSDTPAAPGGRRTTCKTVLGVVGEDGHHGGALATTAIDGRFSVLRVALFGP